MKKLNALTISILAALNVFLSSYVYAVDDADLVLWYRIDGESAAVRDFSNSPLPEMPIYGDGSQIIDANRFKVLRLNYQSNPADRKDGIIVDTKGYQKLAVNAITISLWACIDDQQISREIYNHDNLGPRLYAYNGGLIFKMNTDLTADAELQGGFGTVTDGQWAHYCAVFEPNLSPNYNPAVPSTFTNGFMKIYINGVLINELEQQFGRAVDTSDMPILIGYKPFGDGTKGMWDEIKVYNRALSSQEVLAVYQDSSPNVPKIWSPKCGDSSTCVSRSTELWWNPGNDPGLLSFNIYIRKSGESWPQPVSINKQANHFAADNLLLGSKYEWMVEQVSSIQPFAPVFPRVYSFNTADYMILDDFENYSSGVLLRDNWKRMYVYSSDYARLIAPYGGDSDEIYSAQGGKCLKLFYNTGISPYKAMLYKTSTPFDLSPANQNIKSLGLKIKGNPENTPAAVFAYLKDSFGNSAAFVNNDSSLVTSVNWRNWDIDLQDFMKINPSLDLSKIVEYGFGVGDGSQNPSHYDFAYFDDIRAYQPHCVPDYALNDFTGDCKVDVNDLLIMAQDWLNTEIISQSRDIAHWTFEDGMGSLTAADTSGYLPTAHGMLQGQVAVVSDSSANRHYVLSSTGDANDYVLCDVESGQIRDKYDFENGGTVMAWINPSVTDRQWLYIIGSKDYGPRLFQMGNEIKFGTTVSPPDWGNTNIVTSGANLQAGNWYHVAGVYDAANRQMSVYVNGVRLAYLNPCSANPPAEIPYPYSIGNNVNPDSSGFVGKIDDVVIYNYPLTEQEINLAMSGYSHWDFEDGIAVSSAADKSGYLPTASGKFSGTAAIVSDSNSNRNYVLNCDGNANNYVLCSTDFGTSQDKYHFQKGGTVSVWIKPSATDGQWLYIIGPKDYGPRLFQMGTEIKFGTTVNPTDWANTNIVTSGANLLAGKWYHVAGVYDAVNQQMSVYVNGVRLAYLNPCSANTPSEIPYPYSIGNDVNLGSSGFVGKIDDVTVYNYPLTEDQIIQLMNGNEKLLCIDNYEPLTSAANLYDFEPQGQKIVNYRDFSIMADEWLQTVLWP